MQMKIHCRYLRNLHSFGKSIPSMACEQEVQQDLLTKTNLKELNMSERHWPSICLISDIPDEGNCHKKFVRCQTQLGLRGHVISVAR